MEGPETQRETSFSQEDLNDEGLAKWSDSDDGKDKAGRESKDSS